MNEGARIRWQSKRGAPLREGIAVVEVPLGAYAQTVLDAHLAVKIGRASHRRERRFASTVAGPCWIARVGVTGSKFFCGYFSVTQRMIDLAKGAPSP